MRNKTMTPKKGQRSRLARSIFFRRSLALFITMGVCSFLTWLVLFSGDVSSKVQDKIVDNTVRPVTVIQVKQDTYQAHLEVFGEVTPEWKVALKSKVQGEILTVATAFRKGNTVKKGELLLAVEQAAYQVQQSEAILGFKKASTKLLVEQREGVDAHTAWERSGLKEVASSPLLLRKPYLETAEANLEAAKARVRQATLLMGHTQIKAPFDSLVVARNVSLGGTLFSGDEVGVLYGMNTFVVSLHISDKEWKKLSLDWKGMEVQLHADGSGHQWTGTLVREGKIFERDSRLRTLFVEIDQPLQQSPPLLPGTFVKVEIPGRLISGLLRIPDSARTQKGLVWYVDDTSQLQSVQATPVFREKGYLYFRYQAEEMVTIVVNPNNSFVNGLQVTPIVREN